MTLSPILLVSIALAASVAGNGLLARSYLSARDDATTARAGEGQARDAAKQCSDGVLSLQAAAETRAKQAEAARAEAERKQRAAQATAAALMGRKPTVPGDWCASAQAQIDDWLANR